MGEKILFLQDYFPNVRECLLSILESPAGILMLIMSWLYQCSSLLMSLSSEPAIPTHASSFTCNWGSILNHKLRHGTTQLKNQIKTRNQLYDFDQSKSSFSVIMSLYNTVCQICLPQKCKSWRLTLITKNIELHNILTIFFPLTLQCCNYIAW